MKRILFYIFLCLFTAGFGLCAGSEWIAPGELFADGNELIFSLRASRLAAAFAVGGSLALSGLLFQAILRNPLADPFILGLSGGAAAGAALAFLTGAVLVHIYAVSIFAFAGALLVLAAVLLIARNGDSLLMTGVMIGTIVSGVLMYFVSAAQNTELAGITWWMLGDLQAADRLILCGNLFLLTGGCLTAQYFARDLDALSLGQDQAWDLGVNVRHLTLWLTILASLLAAVSVALAGIIGFCGLVVPHIMKRLHGAVHRRLILPSVLGGGSFLMFCDTLARLDSVREIPVGVVTALTGGPLFLYLLNRRKQNA